MPRSPARSAQVQGFAVPRRSTGAEDEADEAEELESELADLDRHTLEHLRCTATRLYDIAFSPSPCSALPHASVHPIFLPAKLMCCARV